MTQKYDFHGQNAYVDGLKEGAEEERVRWKAKLEPLRPYYETLRPTVVPSDRGCPCEFCQAKSRLVEGLDSFFKE